MTRHRRLVLPLLAALALAALSVAVSACGYSSTSKDVKEGEPVTFGHVHYNVIFSRYLNPHDNEDAAYLVGEPEPPDESTYFGIFLEVQNKSEESQKLPKSFTIEDAFGGTYHSLPTESLYAFPLGGEVESQEQIPVDDSTAQQGPIAGSLVLFLLPDSASENRPLTLLIDGAEGEEPARVLIDL
jgi:hypothetical protein